MGLGVWEFWVEGLGLRVFGWGLEFQVSGVWGFRLCRTALKGRALHKKRSTAFFSPLLASALLYGNKNLRNAVPSFIRKAPRRDLTLVSSC